MKTVVFRTNLGAMDAKKINLDHATCRQGDSAEVAPDVADSLVKSGIAVLEADAEKDPLIQSAWGIPDNKPDPTPRPSRVRGVAKPAELKGVEEDSPVANLNVAEAIEKISHMHKENLQKTVDNDKRATVVDAAKKRLASL